MKISLTDRECSTLINALQRASEWSDVYDNSKHLGKKWTKDERAFIARCERLIDKLRKARGKEPHA